MSRVPVPSASGWTIAIVAVTVTVVVQLWLGRPPWCSAGDSALWSADIWTLHNSQHPFDPYTFTHVLHGIGLYGLLWLLLRQRLDGNARFATAIALESAWEILENTPAIIERYRADTISLGYLGDSVVNSVGDIAACALGYLLAIALPVWGSVALFAGAELLLLLWIRDSLILNIVMLLWPVEWIKQWQMGG